MGKKESTSQRRKHEKIEDEFLRSRLSLAVIEKAGSIKLEAYLILQETLVMLRNRRMEAGGSATASSPQVSAGVVGTTGTLEDPLPSSAPKFPVQDAPASNSRGASALTLRGKNFENRTI